MYGKIEITGTIEVITGMHIGASDGFAAIGAIDSPVAKDPLSALPYIPGSSLKGKMRSLLAKMYNTDLAKTRDDDAERITRLFGASKSRKTDNPHPSRLLFSDAILSNEKELKALGAQSATEAKEENTINPLTAAANPRQIERVIRGATFPLHIIYNAQEEEELLEDMETLAMGLKLITYDYIGGHGSRGYGKIAISDLDAVCVIGDISQETMAKCSELIQITEEQ